MQQTFKFVLTNIQYANNSIIKRTNTLIAV